ncbi:MAG: integrin alpha, partial [Pseudomonadota bacterium]
FPARFDVDDLDGANGFEASGSFSEEAGYSVAGVGDVNGDGIDDFVIGAPEDNGGSGDDRLGAGSAYLIFGDACGFDADLALADLDGTDGVLLKGFPRDLNIGASVSAAGDVNGDGFADFIVGAPGSQPYSYYDGGAAFVVFGKNGQSLFDRPNNGGGAAMDGAAPAEVGITNVRFDFGYADGVTETVTAGFRIGGFATDDYAGTSVAGGGDVNGDGFDDVIVGAFGFDDGAETDAGAAYVIFGGDDIRPDVNFSVRAGQTPNLTELDGTNGFLVIGEAAYDQAGFSVDIAGDVNGDGIDDILIGARQADPGDVFGDTSANRSLSDGSAYVIFGSDDGFAAELRLADLTEAQGFRIDGVLASESELGFGVSGVGDVNGDGIDDLAVQTTPKAVTIENNNGGNLDEVGNAFILFGARTITQGSEELLVTDLGEEINGIGGAD